MYFGTLKASNFFVKRRRYFFLPLVWLIILAMGATGVELYARHLKGYNLWSLALSKGTSTAPVNPNFFELDRLKVWNQKFYESRSSYFVDWPIPLEFFDAEGPTPRYLFKPNLQMTAHNDQMVPAQPGEKVIWSSNSWGFRGPEFPIEKPPGTIRIVCLGASTTEGSQGDEETYPYYLQLELNRRFPGRDIEVINAGHHGHGIQDLAAIEKQRVFPLEPDIVILYETANDLYPAEWTNDPWTWNCCYQDPSWYRFLRQYSALFLVISDGLKQISGERIPPPQAHLFDPTLPHPGLDGWAETVRQIVQESKASGVTIALSSFITVAHEGLEFSPKDRPWVFNDLYRKWYPFTPGEIAIMYDHYNAAGARIARDENVPYCDVAAQYPKDPYYFGDHIHFTPEGNQLLAKLFADCLEEKVLPGLLSNEHPGK